jgi:hypothetical protein
MVTRVWGVEEADAERGGGEGGVGARARPGVAATTSRRSTLSAHLLGPAEETRPRLVSLRETPLSELPSIFASCRRLTRVGFSVCLFPAIGADEPLRFRAAAAAFVPPLSVRARGCRAGVSARSPSEMGKKAKGKHRLGACPLPSSPNRAPPLAPSAVSSEPPPPAPTLGRRCADDARDDERTA